MRKKGKISVAFDPNLRTAARPGQLAPKRPVAGYLRSATQLEGDTLREQLEAIVRFARDRDMQLIRIYCDECGSGLTTDSRSALQQMLRDLEIGAGDFDAVLLLDPSRWGRFHNPDQAACLEYACRRARIDVHYCAEGFDEDETPLSGISKSLKRHMANECERESAARKHHAAGAATRDADAPSSGATPKMRPQ